MQNALHVMTGREFTMQAEIRVFIIDDHDLIAVALQTTLSDQDAISVVGRAATGQAGIDEVAVLTPDVVLVDYRLPDMTGADVIRSITATNPRTRCIVLTGSGQENAMLESLEAGAFGFLSKNQRFHEIVTAIRSASSGEMSISPEQIGKLLPRLRGSEKSTRLTSREREVLARMAGGNSNSEIAASLFLSVNTIRNHVSNILNKLGARSQVEAVAIATRQGLVVPGGGTDNR